MFEFLKGYRTFVANILMAVLPILEMSEITTLMPKEYLPWYAIGMAIANMGLRLITTGPVGQK